MPYALMIAGLVTMCVPEDASMMRFALQGAFGLTLFIRGWLLILDEKSA